MKFTRTDVSELQTIISGRTFKICGDSKDDYYTVFGVTEEEVKKHQHKLDSSIHSRMHYGKFKKLSDAKEFIRLVMGEI